MPKQSRIYTVVLSDTDLLAVRQVRDGYEIIDFSVQYSALIKGKWRRITRYDNAHGYAHRHVYYFNGREYREQLAARDNNEVFTKSQLVLRKTFLQLRENYIITMERGGDII